VEKKERFITAIKSNEGLVYKIATIYTNSIEDRDDLVQEIIYQLWRSFDSFDQRSSLSTWMYRVALNVAIYHLKKARKKISTVALEGQDIDLPETADNGLEEKLKFFRQQVDNLGLLDKAIVMLYLENKSHEEIAQITGISTSNVGTKISRIKEKLKKQITKHL